MGHKACGTEHRATTPIGEGVELSQRDERDAAQSATAMIRKRASGDPERGAVPVNVADDTAQWCSDADQVSTYARYDPLRSGTGEHRGEPTSSLWG